MTALQTTISPIDGSVLAERPLATPAEIDATLTKAKQAQREWRRMPLAERIEAVRVFVHAFSYYQEEAALEITQQMGRPLRDSPGEIAGFISRAQTMVQLAPEALADIEPPKREGFTRFIRREPLGVVLVLAPWNYPYLTAVNSIVPALLAGNSIVLKHSDQTPLCAERLSDSARQAGLPDGLFAHVHASHADVANMVRDERVDFVSFTGSVEGGRAVHRASGGRFIAVGLELGGKDPAYVRDDADLSHAVPNLVEGAFYNAGQSCCGVERIYVHQSRFDDFVEAYVAETQKLVLGNPLDMNTTLGPVVRTRSADSIRAQIKQAVATGAQSLIDPTNFPAAAEGTPYLAPQVLINVDHTMDVMREETFGPLIGIQAVASDDEAIERMNDSAFGLTASVWTPDAEAALRMGEQVETGTWFLNRCDYLDPELAWTGVKNSGRGCTLSSVGYEHLTRPKSFHLRTEIGG